MRAAQSARCACSWEGTRNRREAQSSDWASLRSKEPVDNGSVHRTRPPIRRHRAQLGGADLGASNQCGKYGEMPYSFPTPTKGYCVRVLGANIRVAVTVTLRYKVINVRTVAATQTPRRWSALARDLG